VKETLDHGGPLYATLLPGILTHKDLLDAPSDTTLRQKRLLQNSTCRTTASQQQAALKFIFYTAPCGQNTPLICHHHTPASDPVSKRNDIPDNKLASSDPKSHGMSRKPSTSNRKRSHAQISGLPLSDSPNTQDSPDQHIGQPELKRQKQAEQPQRYSLGFNHDGPQPELPNPMHVQTARILRTQSPQAVQCLVHPQHLSPPYARNVTPAAGAQFLQNRRQLHSYGSMTTLHPAFLPVIPDPTQIAEIKKVMPQRLMRNGTNLIDMWAMVDALRMDGQSTRVAPTPVVPSQSDTVQSPTQRAEPLQRASIAGLEDTGADFEALLQALTQERVGVPDRKGSAVA
jgi:hypothetical protein